MFINFVFSLITMFIKTDGVDYITNFYRFEKYDKKDNIYLLTTDTSEFIFLNSPSFNYFRKGKILDEDTYNLLLEKGFIITEKNIKSIVDKTRDRYSFLANGTSLHIVIPTSRCNLGCNYCFASPDPIDANKDEKDLDEKTALRIIEFILNSPSHAITIEFQGGEAIARFDLVQKMADYAKELNRTLKKDLRLTIVSNLTLMNDDIVNWLVDNDITICTSLDGPKIVHDANRIIHVKNGNEIGTYERVIYWIDRINKICENKRKKWKINALMTITKQSLPYYKEIIDEYVRLGLNLVDIRSLTVVGKAAEKDTPFDYTFDEFTQFYDNSIKYIKELTKSGIYVNERMNMMYAQKILENKPTYHTDFESPCGAATGQIVYHSNGDIYTCHEALGRDEFKLGNVHQDKWKNIFTREETSKAILNSMLESNVKCDRCVYKPYCGTCMVENFYNFGKFNYYPTKTGKHHETIMQCTKIFDGFLNKIKKAN